MCVFGHVIVNILAEKSDRLKVKKSDIRILVVEDDESLGRALEEGFRRSGYSIRLVPSPSAAENALRLEEYHGMIIDCMLPRKNGVDLASEIKNSYPKIEIALTSGIFRDKAFAREALIKSKAREFFNKPFELSRVIQTFDEIFTPILDADQQPLFELLQLEQYSSNDKLHAVRQTPSIHGLDLPWVYSLLMDPHISGTLRIAYPDSRQAAIDFNKGKIANVHFADSESYFGVLLIEMGFASSEEIDRMLAKQQSKRLGERLVDESYISPHAIGIVRHEQMVIRLSKTIQDTNVEIQFDAKEIESDVFIDGFKFTQLLSDWACSKLSNEWLKSFYRQYVGNPLTASVNYNQANIVAHLPAARVFADLEMTLTWPRTIDQICADHMDRELDILRALHFFLLQRILRFGPKAVDKESIENKRIRLERIWQEMQDQNFFQILGVNKLAKQSEIQRCYRELAKVLHPDRLPDSVPADLRELSQKIFARITQAHSTLSDEAKRQAYTKTLEHGMADEILLAETKFEEGLRLLRSHQFREARKALEKVMKMHGRRSDVVVYYIWSLIKEKRHRADRSELANRAGDLMQTIAHEDRHNPQYFFVKGMYYELTGEIQRSYQAFKHALSLDPNFIDANKEITYIKQVYGKKKSTFTDDLSVVVTKILRRKTG